jgi:Domain of unknown function (DUF4345)
MSRRVLQVTILFLSLLPLVFGGLGIVFGTSRFGISAHANLDSQYRFLSAWYLGLAVLAWWIVPQIERQTALFRIICASVFVGGLARFFTVQTIGWPDTRILVVHLVELLFPLLAVWQSSMRTDR